MGTIKNLWNAVSRLMNSLAALADTVDEANATARAALGYQPEDAEVIEAPKANGRPRLSAGKR